MIDSVLTFIQQNNELAWLVIFIVAFLESMAIIGLLVPGWILLVGVGTLIGSDVLSFYPIAIAAYFGAVIGEYISFHLGYHYHQQILSWRIFAQHKKLIRLSRRFFNRHGASGVFIGRFFGPTRAVVPLAAGIAEMKKSTFFWINLSSGLIWAPLYLIPGILVGAAFNLDKEEGYYLLLVLAIVAFTFVMAVKTARLYWKQKYHKRRTKNKPTQLTVVTLWWAIAIACLTIFLSSSYLDLFVDITRIFIAKL